MSRETPAVLVVDALQGLASAVPVAAQEPTPASSPQDVIARLAAWERDFTAGSAPATVRAVRSDWARYIAWCEATRTAPLPATVEQVSDFIGNAIARGLKRSTINRYVYTVGLVHDVARLPNPIKQPEWKAKFKGHVRALARRGGNAPRQAAALTQADIAIIIGSLGDSPRDLRDAALLLLASDTLCRESELVAARVEDMRPNDVDGTTSLHVRFSKNNQEGLDDFRFVSAETLVHLRRWTDIAGIDRGPLFVAVGRRGSVSLDLDPDKRRPLAAQEIARIFRRRSLAAGLAKAVRVSGHSARVGTASELVLAGATTTEVMDAGGWRSAQMILRYSKQARAGKNAVSRLRNANPGNEAEQEPMPR